MKLKWEGIQFSPSFYLGLDRMPFRMPFSLPMKGISTWLMLTESRFQGRSLAFLTHSSCVAF